MISDHERKTIADVAARYKTGRVLLFGSGLLSDDPRDIDLAVEGLAPRSFFRFYGDLLLALAKPVDLIDLSVESMFTRLVRLEGLKIYG